MKWKKIELSCQKVKIKRRKKRNSWAETQEILDSLEAILDFSVIFLALPNYFNMGFFPFGDNSFILKCYFLYARPFGRKRFMNFCLLMPIAFWFLLFEFLLMVWHLMTFSFNKRSHAYRRWNQRRMSLTIGMLWLSLLRFRSSILSCIIRRWSVAGGWWKEWSRRWTLIRRQDQACGISSLISSVLPFLNKRIT